MKTILVLVKREFWEQRMLLLYLPLVITAVCSALIVTALYKLNFFGLELTYQYGIFLDNGEVPEGALSALTLDGLSDTSARVRESVMGTALIGITLPLMAALFFTLTSYLISCLYQDRKDRSILFWKSMPVSDFSTVASKLLTGLVLAPAITFVCMMALQVILLLISSAFALGASVDIWNTLWQPAQLFSRWFDMAFYFLLFLLWCPPVYTWLLLVSSAARSIPMAWAIGVPMTLMLIERLFSAKEFAADADIVSGFIGRHVLPGWLFRNDLPTNQFVNNVTNVNSVNFLEVLGKAMSLELLFSLGLSAAFVLLAVKFRERAGEL